MNKFTTFTVRCKPHIGKFLENNFGSPAFIPDRHILYRLACSQLFKHNTQPLGGNGFTEYTSTVNIGISYNTFVYSGYNINDVNTRLFNESVDNYIKTLCRTNIDSLLISQEKQNAWKDKYLELCDKVKGTKKANSETAELIRVLNHELREHEITIKQAIDHVLVKTLKLSYDDIAYETIKKDYYRYRNPEKYEIEKKRKYSVTQLSPDLDLFSGNLE